MAEATTAGAVNPMALAPAELRALLADRMAGRPTRSNFRTGHLTVCTLQPMRSVPHRVVCLLGLDDGAFPRHTPRDGDDLILDDPHVGDRDARREDRELLLDALLAAGDRLIVTYTGADERTNTPQPPAVPVGELLDVVDATARGEDGSARARVLVCHPLQPFDVRNFIPGALMGQRTWSLDAAALRGARARAGDRAGAAPFLDGLLPPSPADPLDLEALVRFVGHPVRAFLRARLGIRLTRRDDELDDELPLGLDGLSRWAVGDRLLRARLAGVDARTACRAEIARGTLPPGELGRPVLAQVFEIVEEIVAAARATGDAGAPLTSVGIRLSLPDGRALSGTVAGQTGDAVRTVTYSRVAAKHRLAAWVRLLALTAAHPEGALAVVTVGRAPDGDGATTVRLRPRGDDARRRRAWALDELASVVDLYDRGLREPLPLYCETSAALAQAGSAGEDPREAARGAWQCRRGFDGEDREAEHRLVLGGEPSLRDLCAQPPRADECGAGWPAEEDTRLGRCARRLWDGLLACEGRT